VVRDHEPPPADDAPAFISGAVPNDWFTGRPTVTIDRDEILIVGDLPEPALGDEATEAERASAQAGRIATFRESTREHRITIARQLEHRYRRKVAWGVTCGGSTELFTTLAAPAMTRLRQPERQVLDTLVEAGVARSRAHALAWCVRLVGQHTSDWLGDLRSAMERVEQVRAAGPGTTSTTSTTSSDTGTSTD
jgi:hypothetical protein